MGEQFDRRYSTEDAFKVDAVQAAAQGWVAIAHKWEGGTLVVRYERQSEPAPWSSSAGPVPVQFQFGQQQGPSQGGSRFSQAVSQGFGWGCGCLLLGLAILFIVFYVLTHAHA
ncbi:MAG TPA: hypothetical protein VKR24_07940 [Candidatus Limnocylindrales bacterium]|nr:hypothetical protein [Candidatus Limnocylindrales bacterium]